MLHCLPEALAVDDTDNEQRSSLAFDPHREARRATLAARVVNEAAKEGSGVHTISARLTKTDYCVINFYHLTAVRHPFRVRHFHRF